jgi:pimeloyl-ACP methyl ester carboxylesterase
MARTAFDQTPLFTSTIRHRDPAPAVVQSPAMRTLLARARRWLLLGVLAALLAGLAGCDVVALKQAGLERTMRGAGLVAADAHIGADTLHYWTGGQGPTVVLIHGFGGSAIWLWYPQVEDLARDHRLIVPDLLWFGDSRSDARDFTIDHQVHALEALLDQLGAGESDVVGVSYGGLVAHELASDRPASVRHLVLVDTPGRVYTREDYRLLCQSLGVDDLGKVLIPHDVAGVQTLLGLAYFDPPWVPSFARRQALNALYAPFREERVALLDTLLRDIDVLEARPVTLRARPLVVWGREDQVFPLAIGRRLADELKAPLRVIEKARHAPNLEHPEEFNRILRGFLASDG